jgi:hypothetical protein
LFIDPGGHEKAFPKKPWEVAVTAGFNEFRAVFPGAEYQPASKKFFLIPPIRPKLLDVTR